MRDLAVKFWAERVAAVTTEWREEATEIAASCDVRRRRFPSKCGTITRRSALHLRAVAAWSGATVAVEVGTFVGHSALTIRREVGRVCTCDATNGCLPETDGIQAFHKRTSTQMLTDLKRDGVKAGLFFVDGLLDPADPALMLRVSEPGAIYVFDDYFVGAPRAGVKASRKGIVNAAMLHYLLPDYALILPPQMSRDDVTLAVLAPVDRL